MSDNTNTSSELAKTTSSAPTISVQEGGYQVAPILFNPLAGVVLTDGSIDWRGGQSDDPIDTITITKTAGSGGFSLTRIQNDTAISSLVTVSADGNSITYKGTLAAFVSDFIPDLSYTAVNSAVETESFNISISNDYGSASATNSIVLNNDTDVVDAFVSAQTSTLSVSATAGNAYNIGSLYRLTTSSGSAYTLSTTQTATMTLSIGEVTAGSGGTLEVINLPAGVTVSGSGTDSISVTGTEADLSQVLQQDIRFVAAAGSTLLNTEEAQIQTTLTLQETGSAIVQSAGSSFLEYGTLIPISMKVSAASPSGSASSANGSYSLLQTSSTYSLFPSSSYGVTFTSANGEISVSLVNSNVNAGKLDLSAASTAGIVGSVSDSTQNGIQTVTATFDNATDAAAFIHGTVFDIDQTSAAYGQKTTLTIGATNVSNGVSASTFSENLTIIPSAAPTLSGLPVSNSSDEVGATPFSSAEVTSPGDLPVTVTVSVDDAAGTLSATAMSGVTVAGSDSDSLTLAGDATDVQAALRSVTFTTEGSLTAEKTVSFSTKVSNGYTSSTSSGSLTVEPGVLLDAPASADNLAALLAAVTLSDASATSSQILTLTIKETSGSGVFSVSPSEGGVVTSVSSDGKTVTATGTLSELLSVLAGGTITATDPSVLIGKTSDPASISIAVSDGTSSASVSSTIDVAGSASSITAGQTITTSDDAAATVVLASTAPGSVIDAGASTLTLTNNNVSSAGTTINISNGGTVKATETGVSGDTFVMGKDNSSNTLQIANTGSGVTAVTAAGGTQTIDAAKSISQVTVFGDGAAVNYTGGTGVLVSNAAGNTTDWTISGVTGGQNQLWLGDGTATLNAAGSNQIILGAGSGLNGSLAIQGGDSDDKEEVDFWNGANTTGSLTQTGKSYVTVFGSQAGTTNATLTNGIVALSGGSNNIVAQDAGNVEVWTSGGNTSFTHTGSGNAQFYANGSGTFSVKDTAAATGDLTIGVLSSASSDLLWNATTGAGVASINAQAGKGVVTVGSGVVDATQSDDAALTFEMGTSQENSTINLQATGSQSVSVDTAGDNQTINSTSSTASVIVYGNAAEVNYTGGTGVLVSNSVGNTSDWTVNSVEGGNNILWLGDGEVTVNAAGHNQVILGNGYDLNGTVAIQGGTSGDTEEVDLWNGSSTTGTVTQTGDSYATIFGTTQGSSNITLENGIVVLPGGHNTITAQNAGTVEVWNSAGDTSFVDAGSGSAQFYTTGSGSFDVTDTGSGNAVLTVMQFASSTASGTVVGGAKKLDVTTGGGAVSVSAGDGGLDLSTAGAGALTVDVTKGTDHIVINSGNTGDVIVSGASVNSEAYFSISGVKSEDFVNGNMVVNLSDGHTVTFADDTSSSNITLNLS
ncbi:beta strand repeat-containing protein [Acetobacter sp.]|uniref:beta strand repeat-containing protein n=1 Tax=Acetobacter sp. TaxID=440 RepID=UPI0039E7F0CD